MANTTLVNRYDDGITINLTTDAMDAIATALGAFVDFTPGSLCDEAFELLVNAGADYEAYGLKFNSSSVDIGD